MDDGDDEDEIIAADAVAADIKSCEFWGGGGGGGPPLTRRGSRVRDLQRMFDLDRGSGMLAS